VIAEWFARMGRAVGDAWEVVCWNVGFRLRQAAWGVRAAVGLVVGGLTGGLVRRLWWPVVDRVENWWLGPRGPIAVRFWMRDRDLTADADLRWFLWRTRLQDWLRARGFWHLIGALPVLAFLMVIGLLVLWGTHNSREDLVYRYRTRARYASLSRNHAAARVCYERLANLGENEADNHFHLALSLEALGQHAQATALLARLIVPGEGAYPPALVYEARRLLNAPLPSRPDVERAEHYLQRAVEETELTGDFEEEIQAAQEERLRQADPVFLARLEALTLLGKQHLAAGRIRKAEECLQAVVAEGTPTEPAKHRVLGPETPLVAEAHRVLGKHYVSQGKHAEAEIHLLVAANHLPPQDPGRVEVQVLLAHAYLGSELPDEAEPHLRRVLEANRPDLPATAEAHALMGQRYARAQRYQEAEEQLLHALESPTPTPTLKAKARAMLGQIYLNTRRYAEAEQQLKAVLDVRNLEPVTVAGVNVLLARVYLSRGRYTEAEDHLLQALAVKVPELEATAEAHALIGQLYEITGRRDKAEYYLKQGAAKRPELGLSLGRLLLARGERIEARQQLGRALQVFRRQAEDDPCDVQARLNWAEAATLRGDATAAIAALQPALTASQVQPLGAYAWRDLGLGTVVLQQHWANPVGQTYGAALGAVARRWFAELKADSKAEPARRLEALDLLLRYDPGNKEVFFHMLAAAQLRGTDADTLRGLRESLRRASKAPVLVGVLLALDGLAGGDNPAAREQLRDVLRLAPQVGQALNNLAFLLAKRSPGQREQARALMDAVLERWPEQAHYRDTRGQILAQLKQWEAARADLEAALPGLTKKEATYSTLIQVYQNLGRPEKAAEYRRLLGKPQN
jgi:tetratricopeptide (TPR) repeat protein